MTGMQITALSLAERFIGIKEAPGVADNPLVLGMLQLDAKWVQHDDVAWCFAGDVEVLTDRGFVRFDALTKDAVVAQINGEGQIDFTRPVAFISQKFKGLLAQFKSRELGMTCDAKHRFWGVWNRSNFVRGVPELRPLTDLTSCLFVPSVHGGASENGWSERELRLLAAYLSDGYTKEGRIAIQVSRERKLSALAELGPASVYEASKVYGQSTVPLTTFNFEIPRILEEHGFVGKEVSWPFVWSLSKEQARSFLSAYANFDGHTKGGSVRLYTSRADHRDWLQAIATWAGYHSSWRVSSHSPYSGAPCFEVVFAPSKTCRYIRPEHVEYREGELELYCVEVPTGVIVIRDPKGTVLPAGNCSAFANYIAWLLNLPRSRSLAARSWLRVGKEVALSDARPGFDVVIFSRGTGPQPGPTALDAPGHVAFFAGRAPGSVRVVGGNQSDAVTQSVYSPGAVLGVRRLWGD